MIFGRLGLLQGPLGRRRLRLLLGLLRILLLLALWLSWSRRRDLRLCSLLALPPPTVLPLLLAAALRHRLAADLDGGVVLDEVLALHPEDTVVGEFVVQGLLDLRVLLPHVTLVTPVPLPLARAPRVPQAQHVPAGARDVALHGDDRVSVPLDDAVGVRVLVAASVGGGAHEVGLLVVVCQQPEHVRPLLARAAGRTIGPLAVVVWVPVPVVRVVGPEGGLNALPTALVQDELPQLGGLCSCQHCQGKERIRAVDVGIAPSHLCDRLLEDAGPDLVVLAELHEARQATLAHGDAIVHLHWHHLVLRKVHELDSVLPVLRDGVGRHNRAHLGGELAHRGEGGEQPAVPQGALLDVAGIDALDHVDVRELVPQALTAARARPAFSWTQGAQRLACPGKVILE
mmetsp:Transcript_106085/g.330896  ORF Transcript_106085/g.330896 Transcript_106085/m.330896 type:complete len:400 (-) Transcript_106085:329-1528(-)